MGRSLSLAAYMAWSRRSGRHMPPPDAVRPTGALIWGHAITQDHADAMVQLAERLSALRPGLHMLLTTPEDVPGPTHRRAAVIHQTLPDDTVPSAEAFLDYWAPDLCLWTGGTLQPVLINCADKRALPLFLIDADAAYLPRSGWRLLPDLPRSSIACFSAILARTETAARHIQRMGVSERDITVTGLFREGAMALPHDESLRAEMADCLRGRPVWLAAMVQTAELETILEAHRKIERLSHRLFLVLVPDELDQIDAFRAKLDEDGWRYAAWSEGGMPDENTQILLADTRGEMGLWYRLATVTLMASSLAPGHNGRDPNEPAAHGSAIMYGPNVGRFLPSYKRYAEAGAARIVRDVGTLAAALGRLIAPDQSAAMAHAAWDVASTGAQVTDQVIDLVQDTLDVLEAQ